jgi:hypothetical protein
MSFCINHSIILNSISMMSLSLMVLAIAALIAYLVFRASAARNRWVNGAIAFALAVIGGPIVIDQLTALFAPPVTTP